MATSGRNVADSGAASATESAPMITRRGRVIRRTSAASAYESELREKRDRSASGAHHTSPYAVSLWSQLNVPCSFI